jgi:glyoxylase I family protein
MAIKIRQVAHVCILARDLAETRDFYGTVLGLPVKFSFHRDGRWIGFYLDAGGRTDIEVFERPEAGDGPAHRIDHLCFEVEDIDAAVAHVRSRGVAITDKKLGVDQTWQAWVTDPNGVRIELFEYTDRSAQFVGGDRVADW